MNYKLKKVQKVKKYIPTWQALESIGNNKLVKSSYIWIIIIPIVAKLLENIPENLEVPFYKNIIITPKYKYNRILNDFKPYRY